MVYLVSLVIYKVTLLVEGDQTFTDYKSYNNAIRHYDLFGVKLQSDQTHKRNASSYTMKLQSGLSSMKFEVKSFGVLVLYLLQILYLKNA
jgi:hypothetical protein